MRLTWDDLLIEKPQADPQQLLEEWTWLLKGTYRPIVWSKFGDCFLERQSGDVDHLDVLGGGVRKVADSPDAFRNLINQRENQYEWMLAGMISDLHDRGLVPKEGECYALKTHPAIGGKLELENIIVMPLLVWSILSGQLYRQVKDGVTITEFKLRK